MVEKRGNVVEREKDFNVDGKNYFYHFNNYYLKQ